MNKYKFYSLHLFMFVSLALAWLFMLGTQLAMSKEISRHIPVIEILYPLRPMRLLFGGRTHEVWFNVLIAPAVIYIFFLIRKQKFMHCYFIIWFFLGLLCYWSYISSSTILIYLNAHGGGGCGIRFFTFMDLLVYSMQSGVVLILHGFLFYLWKKNEVII